MRNPAVIVKVEREEDVEHGVRVGRAIADVLAEHARIERAAKICVIVSVALGLALLWAKWWTL